MILVFVVNSLSRPRAPRSRRPEPNGLLGLPTQNQTLWCERVIRQENSIVPVSEIGSILVSWRRTRLHQKIWVLVGNPSRPFGSALRRRCAARRARGWTTETSNVSL